MSRRLECTEEGSSKFWEITVLGSHHTVTFGRVGTSGQSKVKVFESAASADKDAESLIRSKIAKGYKEVGKVEGGKVESGKVKSEKVAGEKKAISQGESNKKEKKKVEVADVAVTARAPATTKIEGLMTSPVPASQIATPPSGPTRIAQRICVDHTGEFLFNYAFPQGRLVCFFKVKTETAILCILRIYSSAGAMLHEFTCPRGQISGFTWTIDHNLIFVCGGLVYRCDGQSLTVGENVGDAVCATFQADGTAVIATKTAVRFRTPQGAISEVAKSLAGFRPPVFFPDGTTGIICYEDPSRLLILDRAGVILFDYILTATRATQPIQTTDGRIAVASGNTLHVFGPGLNHFTATLSGSVPGDMWSLNDGWIAVPTLAGTVEFFSPKGECTVFRRDPVEVLDTKSTIACLADGTVIAPASDGTLFRLSQNGVVLGSCKIGTSRNYPVGLDDGTVVIAQGRQLHFLGAADFIMSEPMGATPDLSAEITTLTKHFAGWAVTPTCKRLLAELLSRLVECERDQANQSLRLGFSTDRRDIYRITFGPPVSVTGWPRSYQDVSALHGTICNQDQLWNGVYFGECTAELSDKESKKFRGWCDADQNWLLFDTTKLNKLGEPMTVVFDHGSTIGRSKPFPDQNKEAFGCGGLLIRSWSHKIFSKNEDYDNWGLG